MLESDAVWALCDMFMFFPAPRPEKLDVPNKVVGLSGVLAFALAPRALGASVSVVCACGQRAVYAHGFLFAANQRYNPTCSSVWITCWGRVDFMLRPI